MNIAICSAMVANESRMQALPFFEETDWICNRKTKTSPTSVLPSLLYNCVVYSVSGFLTGRFGKLSVSVFRFHFYEKYEFFFLKTALNSRSGRENRPKFTGTRVVLEIQVVLRISKKRNPKLADGSLEIVWALKLIRTYVPTSRMPLCITFSWRT